MKEFEEEEISYQLTPKGLMYLKYGETQAKEIVNELADYIKRMSDPAKGAHKAILLENGELIFRTVYTEPDDDLSILDTDIIE